MVFAVLFVPENISVALVYVLNSRSAARQTGLIVCAFGGGHALSGFRLSCSTIRGFNGRCVYWYLAMLAFWLSFCSVMETAGGNGCGISLVCCKHAYINMSTRKQTHERCRNVEAFKFCIPQRDIGRKYSVVWWIRCCSFQIAWLCDKWDICKQNLKMTQICHKHSKWTHYAYRPSKRQVLLLLQFAQEIVLFPFLVCRTSYFVGYPVYMDVIWILLYGNNAVGHTQRYVVSISPESHRLHHCVYFV